MQNFNGSEVSLRVHYGYKLILSRNVWDVEVFHEAIDSEEKSSSVMISLNHVSQAIRIFPCTSPLRLIITLECSSIVQILRYT